MTKAATPIPSGQHTITPHLVLKDVAKAIDFYKEVFGAEEIYRFTMPDGRIMHANLKIGDSHLMLADEFPEHGCGCSSPESLKGTNTTIHLYVADVDKSFQRAVEAGSKAEMPPQDMFWGDRYGRIVDPFGQPWSLATHQEDLMPDEIQKRGTEFFKLMASAK